MAKELVLTQVKKKKAEFNLVGKAKIGDFTYKMDIESEKSDWVYNSLNLSVDCGKNCGLIYAECMGGYGSERENKLHVHGKKENENGKMIDDFDNGYKIDWEDRLDEDIINEVGEKCFFKAGLEKDENGKIVVRNFISEYDFIEYVQAHLEDGATINIKGDLQYSIYNEVIQMKKKIRSIFLSSVKEEDQDKKFKAKFTQTLLLDSDAVGKLDKDTMTIPVTARVVDYVKEYNGKLAKRSLPLTKVFEIPVTKDEVDKIVIFKKQFKAKKKTITSLTVEGVFTKGNAKTVEVTIDDLDTDTRELIEAGYLDLDECLGQVAFVNGGGKQREQTYIKRPHMVSVENGDKKSIKVDRVEEIYTEDDLDINLILLNVKSEIPADENIEEDLDQDEEISEDLDDDDWMNVL